MIDSPGNLTSLSLCSSHSLAVHCLTVSTNSVTPRYILRPKGRIRERQDRMIYRREEGSETLFAIDRARRRSLACCGGRMTVEYGRGLRLKSAPSSLLTHSTIINSFSSFYSRIPPPSFSLLVFLFFLLRAFPLLCYLSHERYPGVTKPDESALDVLREVPVDERRLTEISNSIYFY